MRVDSETPAYASVLSFLEDMDNTVSIVLRLAGSGRALDLAGLDEQIGLLCAKTLDLPPHRAKALRPGLIALLGKVDAALAALGTGTPPTG